jgi:hypothetical protein
MNISKTVFALLIVPMLGTLAFAPAHASADQGGNKGQHNGERIGSVFERGHGYRMGMGTTTDIRSGGRGHMGGHHGGVEHSTTTAKWRTDVLASVKGDNLGDFSSLTNNTPLGTSTTDAIFNKLADASDFVDAGKLKEAHDVMKELRDAGYHFKQLFHDALVKLFPKAISTT